MKMPHNVDSMTDLKATTHRTTPHHRDASSSSLPSSGKHQQHGKDSVDQQGVSPYGGPPVPTSQEHYLYPPHHHHHQGPHRYPYPGPHPHHPFAGPRPNASAFNDLTHATNVHMPPPPPPSSSPMHPHHQYPYEGHPYPPYSSHEGQGGGGYSYFHHHPDARPLMPPMHHHHHHPAMGPPPPRFMAPPPPPPHLMNNNYDQYHQDQQQQYTNFLPPPAVISSTPSNKSSGSSVASLTPRGGSGSMDASEYSPTAEGYSGYHAGEQVNEVGPNDVLCGRGAPTNFHPGNEYFRELVQSYQGDYLKSKRADKPLIASQIVNIIHSRGGRFLRRHKRNGTWERGHFVWEEIDPQKSYEKACQALREGAPELRRKLHTANSSEEDGEAESQCGATTAAGEEERMQDSSERSTPPTTGNNKTTAAEENNSSNDKNASSSKENNDDDRNDAMQDSERS